MAVGGGRPAVFSGQVGSKKEVSEEWTGAGICMSGGTAGG